MKRVTQLLCGLLVVGLLVPTVAVAQTFVRLQPTRATGTLTTATTSITLTATALGAFGSVKIQTLDSYSGTWELQCSLDGTTFDTDNELKLTMVDSTTVVYSVTDEVGIWDVGNAAGCKSIKMVETAGFAASDTAVVISATQSGGSGGSGGGTTGDTELPDAAALADDTANPTVPGTASFLMCFDGVTWDRCPTSDGGAGVVTSNTSRVTIASNQPPVSGTLKSGAITAAMTGTTSTVVIAAQASNYLYISSCSFSNTHASVTTMMQLQDGSGGTTLWEGVVPFGGGNNITFPAPLKVPTLGNALYTVNVTTGSNTFASCNGFYSTASY